jgi:hypothetical protein
MNDATKRRSMRTANVSLDVTGGIAAGVCAIHCLLTPVLLAYAGLGIADTAISERLEVAFGGLSLVVGLASLGPAFIRMHRDPIPLVLFGLGLGMLFATRLLHAPAIIERCIVPGCALLVIGAHARNHRSCARCRECERRQKAADVDR